MSKTRKHIPQRTCVGCRQVQAKREMVRIIRTPSGLQIDPTGKMAGRGVYIHNQRSCWETGIKGPVSHALKTSISKADQQYLYQHMNSLPLEE
jgi:uncharacterized protein